MKVRGVWEGTALAKSPQRRMRRAAGQLGFTLIEMLLVVGIIAVVMSFVVSSVNRQRSRVRVDQAVINLKTRISKARSLAAAAGSRLGTPRFVGCAPGDDEMSVSFDFDAETYIVPEALTLGNNDVMTANCVTYSFADETLGGGQLDSPAGTALRISFTAEGRLMATEDATNAVVAPVNLFISATGADGAGETQLARHSFRVLPSGVLCEADDPTQVRCAGATP